MMRSYTVRFHVEAPPQRVWRVLHPPAPPNAPARGSSPGPPAAWKF
ncbi:hypothetical protein I549_3566 [Mycobacterium avium subsp. avium 2285 (R)]|nr:hypothetical protein I549_3566 [Mycobacterium avium subsp. avium 2285 (R)]